MAVTKASRFHKRNPDRHRSRQWKVHLGHSQNLNVGAEIKEGDYGNPNRGDKGLGEPGVEQTW